MKLVIKMMKAIIAGLDLNDKKHFYHMDELNSLAEANGFEVVFSFSQKLDKPQAKFFLGTGKINEIKTAVSNLDALIVIFNDELSASQIRNLENFLEVQVIDRSMLILNIFANRAQTKDAKVEIELAQLNYLLPRLASMTNSLSRQGGGFRAKGPGEKQIELDRRKIEKQILILKNELKNIKKSRITQRKSRNIKTVAIVGYTNAGKSSLMNILLSMHMDPPKTVLEKDQLFATLTTHARKITLPTNQKFILIDTVGFISKLPHHLINSFKSTLEEINDADLILHVVDSSNPFYEEHIKTTNDVLNDLGVKNIPTFFVFNKADLLSEQAFPPYENSLLISTKTKQNVQLLVNKIKEALYIDDIQMELLIPYDKGDVLALLEEKENINYKKCIDKGIHVIASVNNKNKSKYNQYKKTIK